MNKTTSSRKKQPHTTSPIGLYIHIPFCKTKCNYCSFISHTKPNSKTARYFNALHKEITYYKHLRKPIRSIYIGGGTPSFISETYIVSLLKKCFKFFPIRPNAEITIEVNPNTVTQKKLMCYKSSHINRISMGIQSFNDKSLLFLGRNHTEKDILKSYKLCASLFPNISLDLIFGYKGQTTEQWKSDLQKAIALNPSHISLYDLSIEPKSKFFKRAQHEDLLLSEDQTRKMYLLAQKTLLLNKFHQYEVSNFCKKNRPSKHNLIYWNNEEYLGLGVGAISYINQRRYGNTKSINRYIDGYSTNMPVHINQETLPPTKAAIETLILSLRNIQKGADLNKIEKRFAVNIDELLKEKLPYLKKHKLVNLTDNKKMSLTQKGILLFDHVAVHLL